MRRIAVDMQKSLFADAIVKTLQRFDPGFEVYSSEYPQNTIEVCQMINANILIMEVGSFSPWQFIYGSVSASYLEAIVDTL